MWGDGCRCLVQQYIANPFLVDGYKCDMRFYVLGTSFDPLRLYIFGDSVALVSLLFCSFSVLRVVMRVMLEDRGAEQAAGHSTVFC